MSRWFRLYDEVLDDPKVQKLFPEHFKTWINLLCLASKNDGILPDAESVSFALRKPFNETSDELKFLFQSGLLDETKKGLIPHGWSKRQYKSDTSTDRVKRFRQRSRNVEKTVTVTPPDTETEQRQIQTQKRTEFKRGSRLPDDWFPSMEDHSFADRLGVVGEVETFRDYWHSQPSPKGVKLDWSATWRNWCRRASQNKPKSQYRETPMQTGLRIIEEMESAKHNTSNPSGNPALVGVQRQQSGSGDLHSAGSNQPRGLLAISPAGTVSSEDWFNLDE
jgi:hypothetical protein